MDAAFYQGTPSARACTIELERAAERGHNVAAYVAAILLYSANDGTMNDDTTRRYLSQVKGEEEVAVAPAAAGLRFATTGVCAAMGRPISTSGEHIGTRSSNWRCRTTIFPTKAACAAVLSIHGSLKD